MTALNDWAVGVDIGGTKIHFALVDQNGCIIYQEIIPTKAEEGPSAVLKRIFGGIASVLRKAQELDENRHVLGIGVGSAGQIDFATGTVKFAVDTLPGWTGTALKREIELNFPYSVFVDNDVNVLAIAEKCFGAGKSFNYFVCLALGTGVGGAIVESGHLIRGSFGGAGELGHVCVDFDGPQCNCGNYGCLELYASGTGITRIAEEMIWENNWHVDWETNSRDVMEAWKRHDFYASLVMRKVIQALSSATASFIHIFNPEAVIIGGGVSEAGAEFFESLIRETKIKTTPAMWESATIIPATVGIDSGVIGAAAQLWNYQE